MDNWEVQQILDNATGAADEAIEAIEQPKPVQTVGEIIG